jgi:hypothetical protein
LPPRFGTGGGNGPIRSVRSVPHAGETVAAGDLTCGWLRSSHKYPLQAAAGCECHAGQGWPPSYVYIYVHTYLCICRVILLARPRYAFGNAACRKPKENDVQCRLAGARLGNGAVGEASGRAQLLRWWLLGAGWLDHAVTAHQHCVNRGIHTLPKSLVESGKVDDRAAPSRASLSLHVLLTTYMEREDKEQEASACFISLLTLHRHELVSRESDAAPAADWFFRPQDSSQCGCLAFTVRNQESISVTCPL